MIMPIEGRFNTDVIVCPACQSQVTWTAKDRARCMACGIDYPIEDGILIAQKSYEGANQAAAEFYDGRLWRRFKFLERMFYWRHGGEQKARHQFMKFLPAVSGQRIGVCAIGAGNDLDFLPADCEILGIDISAVQLRECASRYSNRGISLVLGEAERLPFADRCVDHSLSAGGFNFFSDPARSLREMVRITRPGGLVVVSDEVPSMGGAAKRRPLVRRFMKRTMGEKFSEVVMDRAELPVNDIFASVFREWTIHSIWRGSGYCAVAKVTEMDHAALPKASTEGASV